MKLPERFRPSTDDELLLTTITKCVRGNPEAFVAAGHAIDAEYNRPRMLERRALARKRAKYQERRAREGRSTIDVFPPERYAVRHDWKHSGKGNLFHLLAAALEDTREDSTGPLTEGAAQRICVLTWLLYDEKATDLSSRICSLQDLPWKGSAKRVWPCRYMLQLSYLREDWMVIVRRAWARLSIELDRRLPSQKGGPRGAIRKGSARQNEAASTTEDPLEVRLEGMELELARRVRTKLEKASREWIRGADLAAIGLPSKTVYSASRAAVKNKDYRGGGSSPTYYSRRWLIKYVNHFWSPRMKVHPAG